MYCTVKKNQKSTNNKCWIGYGEKAPFYTVGGNWYSSMEKLYTVSKNKTGS